MILSVMIFVSGSSLYKKCPPEGNVVVEVSKAVCVSLLSMQDSSRGHYTDSSSLFLHVLLVHVFICRFFQFED